jgi:hypothetical protein
MELKQPSAVSNQQSAEDMLVSDARDESVGSYETWLTNTWFRVRSQTGNWKLETGNRGLPWA